MAGVIPKFTTGPVTYKAGQAIKGGQLVEARGARVDIAAGTVGVAGAGSLLVLGVATTDAKPATDPNSTDEFGNPVLDTSGVSEFTAVGVGFYPVLFTTNAGHGQALIAAAGGGVAAAGAAPDARSVVGYCAEPNGVVAGATGLAKISR